MKKVIFLLCIVLSLCACASTPEDEITAPENVKSVAASGSGIYSNKAFGWGLKKNVKAPPEILPETKALMEKQHAYYLDQIPRSLYLTFDEGYENGYTAQILDVLKENDVKAAFFITGPYLEKETELVERMVKEGHIVGNHTVHHPSMPQVTDDEKLKKEITDLNQRFFELFGINMKYIRPPKGEYSERTLSLSNDLGYTSVFWSFAYQDWDVNKQRGVDYAYQTITNGVHDGCVLLLHAVSKDNANVLDRVIKDLKADGYVFRSLDEFGRQTNF